MSGIQETDHDIDDTLLVESFNRHTAYWHIVFNYRKVTVEGITCNQIVEFEVAPKPISGTTMPGKNHINCIYPNYRII